MSAEQDDVVDLSAVADGWYEIFHPDGLAQWTFAPPGGNRYRYRLWVIVAAGKIMAALGSSSSDPFHIHLSYRNDALLKQWKDSVKPWGTLERLLADQLNLDALKEVWMDELILEDP